MRLLISIQSLLLAGLLLGAFFCNVAVSHPHLEKLANPATYDQAIEKLEGQRPFENKEKLVTFVKALAQAKTTSDRSVDSIAKFVKVTRNWLLVFAFIQATSIWLTFRYRKRHA
jgi:hypothetical protein